MKIVINKCYGGFGLSNAAIMAYAKRKGMDLYVEASEISLKYYGPMDDPETYEGMLHYYTVPPEQYHALYEKLQKSGGGYKELNGKGWYWSHYDVARDDADLVAVVEELGEKANGDHADLAVVDVPDGISWEIDEYDGIEHIAESHRTWE